jgi:hypothetical protein
MACRNAKKAETARKQLYRFIDTQLAGRTSRADREYGDSFRKSLRIEIESCDLSVVSSVLKCGKSLREKYVSLFSHCAFLVDQGLFDSDTRISLI